MAEGKFEKMGGLTISPAIGSGPLEAAQDSADVLIGVWLDVDFFGCGSVNFAHNVIHHQVGC